LPVKTVGGSRVDFLYGLDMDVLGMAPGEEVEYYFEAKDNDGIHGPKVSKTAIQSLRRQTVKEVREDAGKSGEKVQQMLQQAFNQSKQMQKEAQELQQKLNTGKNMAWEEKQRVEDLLMKQQELEKKIEEMKQQQQKLQQQKEEFQSQKPETMERKKQMDELLKQMENPEMKKLMEEIQKLLDQKASKEKIAEKMNEMRQMNKEQSRDLNQLMEQFKELQLEQKLNDNLDRLNKLAEKQDKLAEKTQQQKGDKDGKLKEQQQKLSEEMRDIRKELKEALEMNKGLEKPMQLDLGEQEQDQAESSQQKAGNELENGKNKKAADDQKDAAEQMKKAAEKMQKSMEQEQQKRMAEDYRTLRLLLENLVETSVEQEDVFTALSGIREYNPRFVDLNKRQMVVREQCALLEDSLRALAKRQPMVSTFVAKEISRINNNMDMALEGLKTRDLRAAVVREQFVMTGLNNLAVMLLESMQNMQQKMAQQNQKQGKGSCSNPGGKGKSQGKPNKGDKLSKGQEQLGQMLQEMQKKGQNGKPGKDGQPKPGEGQQGKEMNEEYARIALMQEALRRKLGELRKAMEQGGNGAGAKTLQETEKLMEEQEKELVNKRFNPQLIERQKEIQTRLLEHEKADRNQQTEEQRQAIAPGEFTPTAPASIQRYMQEKRAERETMRRPPAELTPYFREKVNSYLQKIQ
jgi:DNA repair exonuclease SbcCD ATPase subunit